MSQTIEVNQLRYLRSNPGVVVKCGSAKGRNDRVVRYGKNSSTNRDWRDMELREDAWLEANTRPLAVQDGQVLSTSQNFPVKLNLFLVDGRVVHSDDQGEDVPLALFHDWYEPLAPVRGDRTEAL